MATQKSSAVYWQKRAEEREKKWLKKSQEEIEKELKQMYVKSLANIQKETDALYARFAVDNQLSLKEAHKLIKGNEFLKWRMDIEEYVKTADKTKNPALLKELNTLAMRSRITQLDKLQGEVLRELHQLSAGYEEKLTKFLGTALKDQYYSNLFDLNKATGIALPGARLNAAMVGDILRNPWSGKHYSKRIWANTTKLAKVVKTEMTDGMIRGVNAQRMARSISEKMNVGYSQSITLVRTELNYINNQASLKSMKAAGAEKYRFLATLDHRTSPQCRNMDGTVHKIEDASPGTNMPPLHPRCRSSIAVEYGEIGFIGERVARDADGQTYRVPAEIGYKEWMQTYVVNPDLASKMYALKAQIDSYPVKTYANLWKDDVTTKDYPAKQDSIAAKKAYFEEKIKTAANSEAEEKFNALLADLKNFEKNGKIYTKLKQDFTLARDELKAAYQGSQPPVENLYSEERKAAAYRFKRGMKAEADALLRDKTGKLWKEASSVERKAAYTYTSGSGAFNRPLRGFNGNWSTFQGVGKVPLDNEGAGKMIQRLSNLIDRSSFDFDIWLRRGVGPDGVAKFFGISTKELSLTAEKLEELLYDRNFLDTAFISTSPVEGAGFSGCEFRIYAPRGTKMFYAEPFSHYGGGAKLKWDGVSKQSSFGSEFEVILQKGYSYRLKKITGEGTNRMFELEVVLDT